MKKMKKYFVTILIAMFLITSLVGCGSKSSADLIVGRWVLAEESTYRRIDGIEFFSDGDAIGFDGDDIEEANWSISEDSLKLSNPYGSDVILFGIEELTDDRLVLSIEGTDQELVMVKEKE